MSIYNDAACTSLKSAAVPISSGCQLVPTSAEGNNNDEIYNPPPSVSTTAFPTVVSQLDTSSFVYCPTNAPTLKPVLAQSVFPTSTTAKSVSFQIIQVGGWTYFVGMFLTVLTFNYYFVYLSTISH